MAAQEGTAAYLLTVPVSMGSKSGSRNRSDRAPLRSLRTSGVGGSGSTKNEPELVCLASFPVDLKQMQTMKVGLGLSLQDGKVLFNKVEVGALSARLYRMVVACKEEGFGYRGTIATRKDEGKNYFYGLFEKHRL